MNEFDIEAGKKFRSIENEKSRKCSEYIIRVTLTFVVIAVFIAYFMAISRDSNLLGNTQDFDVDSITKSPLPSNSFGFNIFSLKLEIV